MHQNLTFLMEWLGRLYKKLELLDKAIVKCRQCPRLVEWREEVAITKRKAYENEKYWGKPVPGFGPADAKLVILGLAPGAHGANRTGRVFTGDSSGDWLYRALYTAGLAKIPTSTSSKDGQELINTRILCAVRCAPPDNKPSIEEKVTCNAFFMNEISLLLPTAQTFLALGSLAWDSIYRTLKELGCEMPSPKPKFGHGGKFTFAGPDGRKRRVLGSYHPSQQNTFTGKLTEAMLDSVIQSAKAPSYFL
ncbi:MAG: uracil-DNA glycosylase [Candidatus Planktophila sp.]